MALQFYSSLFRSSLRLSLSLFASGAAASVDARRENGREREGCCAKRINKQASERYTSKLLLLLEVSRDSLDSYVARAKIILRFASRAAVRCCHTNPFVSFIRIDELCGHQHHFPPSFSSSFRDGLSPLPPSSSFRVVDFVFRFPPSSVTPAPRPRVDVSSSSVVLLRRCDDVVARGSPLWLFFFCFCCSSSCFYSYRRRCFSSFLSLAARQSSFTSVFSFFFYLFPDRVFIFLV